MFLNKLTYFLNNKKIREIKFKKGMNFIVDNTTNDITMTGNAVGKTTVLKIIDIMFGSDLDILYKDSMGEEPEVKKFLFNNEIKFTLVLNKEENFYNLTIILKRPKSKLNAFYYINNKEFNQIDYIENLKNIIFPMLKGKKLPSLRQIMSRHNRYKEINIEQPLRTIVSGTNDDYEALNLAMLGIVPPNLDEHKKLKKELTFNKKLYKQILGDKSIAVLKESLKLTNQLISKQEKWENLLNENENISLDIDKLNLIKQNIATLSNTLAREKFLHSSNAKSIESILKTKSDINIKELEMIYKNAKMFNDRLHLSFTEFIETHNSLVLDKVKFLEKQLNKLKTNIFQIEKDLNELVIDESKLIQKIEKLGTIENIKKELLNLSNLNYQKAEYEEQIKIIEKSITKMNEIQRKLENLDNELSNLKDFNFINNKVKEINKYFQDISEFVFSKELIKTSFILTNDTKFDLKKDKENIVGPLHFEFVDQNNSSGFKHNSVLFFDVARILFQQNNNIDFLGFVLNDKKEIVYSAQIKEAMKYLEDKNIQIIVSILKENILEIGAENCIILELSTQDKFFRIEKNLIRK